MGESNVLQYSSRFSLQIKTRWVMPCQKSRKDIVKRMGSQKSMDRVNCCANCPCLPSMMNALAFYISVCQFSRESTDDMIIIGESINEVEST
jgi:hypothetical protein